MHKINPGALKRAEFERNERRKRERTQKKREKWRKKENNFFFLIDWGAKEQKKRKNLEAMSCQQKSHKAGKKKKKIQKIVGTPNHQRGSATATELLNHPIFVKLLNKSAQEYGYEQKGVLRIPCHVLVFERVLEALRLCHDHSRDLHDLLNSLPSSDDFF